MQTDIKCPKCGTKLVTNPMTGSSFFLFCPNKDCDYDEESEAEQRRERNRR